MSKSIIQQLMDNEKPFGLMSEEMQEKAREIDGTGLFLAWMTGKWRERAHDQFESDYAYRLRPDYKPEQEIVECEITLNPESNIWGYKCPCSGDPVNADLAHGCPGFRLIGFKFMDETVFGLLIKYSVPGVTPRGYYAYYSDIETKQALEHHATHVLFRRQT